MTLDSAHFPRALKDVTLLFFRTGAFKNVTFLFEITRFSTDFIGEVC